MKVLLIVTTAQIVRLFRTDLINTLIERGHEVTVVADFSQGSVDGEFVKIDVSLTNRSKSITKSLKYYKQIKQAVRSVAPDVVMTFMIKPNTLGVLAARSVAPHARIFAMVEGMGVVYTSKSVKYRLVKVITDFLYKRSMRTVDGLFCLNKYDADYFVKGRFIDGQKVHCIPGIGVNLKDFDCSEVQNFSKFVFVARMLKEKGVEEFCRIATEVKKEYPDAQFEMYGAEEKETSGCIRAHEAAGDVKYCGTTSDVVGVLKSAAALILPTYYREGSSRIIMEAMACGRAVIASDTIGCDHLVEDGSTGYLVPVRDVDGFVKAVKTLLSSQEIVKKMGEQGRRRAESMFDADKINENICRIVEGGNE